jgi:hypothetical protein
VTVLAVTYITNILLASVVFFLAGRMSRTPKEQFSAAWYFTGVLLLLGVAALIGAVDHGFFEPAGLPRYFIQRADWIVLGGVTFCLLMTTAKQFFAPRAQRIVLIVGVMQFAVNTTAVLSVDSFLDVIVNYAPVMLLFLAMNIFGLRNGTGSMQMIIGIQSIGRFGDSGCRMGCSQPAGSQRRVSRREHIGCGLSVPGRRDA